MFWVRGCWVRDVDQRLPGEGCRSEDSRSEGPELYESEDLSKGASQKVLVKGASQIPPAHLTLAA